MRDPMTFETRLADAFDRYTDGAPRHVDARSLAAELAAGGRGWRLALPRLAPRFGGLRLAIMLGLLALASVTGLLFAGGFLKSEPAQLGGGGRILAWVPSDTRAATTYLLGADGAIRASAEMEARGCPQLLGSADAVSLRGYGSMTFRSFDGRSQHRQLTNYAGFEIWSDDRRAMAFVDEAAGASVVTFLDGDVANPRVDWYPIVGAAGGALSPSGDALALAVPDGPDIQLIHLLSRGTDRIVARLEVPGAAPAWASISWSPDASRLVVSSSAVGAQSLVMVTPSDGSIRNLGHWRPGESSFHILADSWSPDGRSIVAGGDSGEVEVIDLDQGVHHRLESLVAPLQSAYRWSPDGTSLAVLTAWRAWPARPTVTIYPLDDSEPRVVELPGTTAEWSEAAWSPDGTMLLTVDAAGPVEDWTGETARILATDVWGDATPRQIASVPQRPDIRLRDQVAPCLEWLPEVQP